MNRRTYQMEGEPDPTNSGGGAPRDLAGYPDEQQLVKAYRNSSTEAQRQKARADALEQALNAINQRPAVNPRGHTQPEDQLAELGIPVDAIDAMVTRRASEIVARSFEPIAKGMTARNSVMAQYPDYQKYENDVAKFIQQDESLNEKYNRMFATDPEAAMDYAFLKFGENQRRQNPKPPADTGGGKRTDAQIPSGRSAEGRTRPQDGGADDVAQAYKRWAETGSTRDRDAFVKARLKGAFSEGFFDK